VPDTASTFTTKNFLAVDLGAESGRVMLATLTPSSLELTELHRFANAPVRLPTGLYWDTLRLFHDIQAGLTVAGRERKLDIDGIGIDTWGVDFGLLGPDGALVDNPRHYRDARNNGIMERTFARVSRERVFDDTGSQFMQFNSLFQLYALRLADSPALKTAERLLFMPDLFNYFLTGVKVAELTIASTSQSYNPATQEWAWSLVEALDIPKRILPEIVAPGTALGALLPHVAEATGLKPSTTVYATACHDTASAVAAVPAENAEPGTWCYISSGTWSLMGLELDEPVINEKSLAMNFTNEVGAERKIRFLKNIAGLWPVQECRRAWALAGREYSYAELAALAGAAEPFRSVVDPDAFLEPGRMPERIAAWARATGQPEPDSVGATCRAILESLACRYREVLGLLEEVSGKEIKTIHIVGGGSRNELLNQLVADATGRVVVAGPTEATAIGNVLVQAIGAGVLSDLRAARALVRRCFPVTRYEPRDHAAWDAPYQRFKAAKAMAATTAG
jgi:rhamnulokinase